MVNRWHYDWKTFGRLYAIHHLYLGGMTHLLLLYVVLRQVNGRLGVNNLPLEDAAVRSSKGQHVVVIVSERHGCYVTAVTFVLFVLALKKYTVIKINILLVLLFSGTFTGGLGGRNRYYIYKETRGK